MSDLRQILLQYKAELNQGLNELAGHDPLEQALSQIKAWIEKKMPKKIRWTIGEQKQFSTKVEDSVFYQAGYNQAIDDLRQQLREEQE